MAAPRWHRVFHPLCGSDLRTLLALLWLNGPPAPGGLAAVAAALSGGLIRLPFTLGERAWIATRGRDRIRPPIFIVGHMRSGTTHLHNLLAASSQFATVPPVLAGMPWEALSLARLMRPLIEQRLPAHRLIDGMALHRDSPTEDELALANMAPLSWYHAIYFPRRFREGYRRGLLLEGASAWEIRRWQARLRHYVEKMAMRDPARPLLLKNPAYSTRIALIRRQWPDARFIHICRDPRAVHGSCRRALTTMVRELALQSPAGVPIEQCVLEVYPLLMQRLLRDLERLPPGRVAHVRLEVLEADPLGGLRAVYRDLNLSDFDAAAPRILAYLDSIRGYRGARHGPAQGLVPRDVDHPWQPMIERLGYGPPAGRNAGGGGGLTAPASPR